MKNKMVDHKKLNMKKTDDVLLAETEIKKIDKKVDKQHNDKLKLWEKNTTNNEKDINVRKQLFEIRNAIKNTDFEHLQENNFFSKQHM